MLEWENPPDAGRDDRSQEVIELFVSAYVVLPFNDVCRVLDRSRPAAPHLRVTGGLRWSSETVAAVGIEWADPSSPGEWRPGEIRVIRVQSGVAPLTEMLLVARSPAAADQARLVLDGLVQEVEASVSGASAPAGQPLAFESVPAG